MAEIKTIIKLKPATIYENRLPIFSPTNRPKHERKILETKYGTVTIDGRLGQRHKDLLEIIKVLAKDIKKTKENRLFIFVEVYQIRKKFSKNKDSYSWQTLRELLWDLMKTTISLKVPNIDIDAAGQFIVSYTPIKGEKTPLGNKIMLMIEFGEIGTQLFVKDMDLSYDPMPLLDLTHGVSKAIARYILSHKSQPNGGWKIDTLINAVFGKNITPEKIRKARMQIRHDAEKLRDCGIILDGDRVFLAKTLKNQ